MSVMLPVPVSYKSFVVNLFDICNNNEHIADYNFLISRMKVIWQLGCKLGLSKRKAYSYFFFSKYKCFSTKKNILIFLCFILTHNLTEYLSNSARMVKIIYRAFTNCNLIN